MVALGCGAFRNNRSGAMGEIPTRNNSNGEIRPPLLAYTEYQMHVHTDVRTLQSDAVSLFGFIGVVY